MQLVILGSRLVLGAVFLMAALTKITDLPGFEERLYLQAGLPATAAWTVARFLPWLELTCGLCLAVGLVVREAALFVTLLLVLFLGHGLLAAERPDCGCFLFPGLEPADSRWWLLGRNLFLLTCGLLLLRKGRR